MNNLADAKTLNIRATNEAPDASEDEMLAYWFTPDKYNYVAVLAGEVVATFWPRANQPGVGKHIGNAAYMVSPDAAGEGIGKKIALWSLDQARRLGFTAIQFNFVVKTNTVAVISLSRRAETPCRLRTT